MEKKLTNHELASQYVSLCNSWRSYIDVGLFTDKLEFTYNDKIYWIGPHRIGIPEFSKDPEGKEIVKTWQWLKYIDIIEDYDLMFLINKKIYQYLKMFINFSDEYALPHYEDQ